MAASNPVVVVSVDPPPYAEDPSEELQILVENASRADLKACLLRLCHDDEELTRRAISEILDPEWALAESRDDVDVAIDRPVRSLARSRAVSSTALPPKAPLNTDTAESSEDSARKPCRSRGPKGVRSISAGSFSKDQIRQVVELAKLDTSGVLEADLAAATEAMGGPASPTLVGADGLPTFIIVTLHLAAGRTKKIRVPTGGSSKEVLDAAVDALSIARSAIPCLLLMDLGPPGKQARISNPAYIHTPAQPLHEYSLALRFPSRRWAVDCEAFLDFVFSEVHADLVSGSHPCTVYEAVRLAGLHRQADVGDFVPGVHNLNTKEEAFALLPAYLDEHVPDGHIELLLRIARSHRSCAGMSKEEAMEAYLALFYSFPSRGGQLWNMVVGQAPHCLRVLESGLMYWSKKDGQNKKFVPYKTIKRFEHGKTHNLTLSSAQGVIVVMTMLNPRRAEQLKASLIEHAILDGLERHENRDDLVPPTQWSLPVTIMVSRDQSPTDVNRGRAEIFLRDLLDRTRKSNDKMDPDLQNAIGGWTRTLDRRGTIDKLRCSARMSSSISCLMWAATAAVKYTSPPGHLLEENFMPGMLDLSSSLGKVGQELASSVANNTLGSHLETINLNHCSLGEEGVKVILKLYDLHPNLSALRLSGNNLTAEGTLDMLNHFYNTRHDRAVTRLDLADNGLTDICVDGLIYMLPSLTHLDVRRNKKLFAKEKELRTFVQHLQITCKLEVLDISDTGARGISVKTLLSTVEDSTIRDLRVGGIKAIGDDDGASLARLLRSGTLNALNVGSAELSTRACHEIGAAMDGDRQPLAALVLRRNSAVSDRTIDALQRAVTRFQTLTTLNLSGCTGLKKKAGAAALCNLVALRPSSISRLNISQCGLSEDSLSQLWCAVQGNKTLTELDLSHTPALSSAIRSFSVLISGSGTGLKTLYLRSCNLGNKYQPAFTNALCTSPTLIKVGLYDNQISSTCLKSILKTLASSRSGIVELDLRENGSPDQEVIQLAQAALPHVFL